MSVVARPRARSAPVIGAEHVALDRQVLRPDVREQLRAWASASSSPSYYPDLVEAMARGGVHEACQRYGYLTLSDARGLVAAAPTVITDEVLVDLLAGPGWLHRACNVMRRFPKLLGMRSMTVGTALDQTGGLLGTAIEPFDDAVQRAAREAGCAAVIWKDVPEGDVRAALRARGYGEFVSLPGSVLDLRRFATLHDYLAWIKTVASEGDLRRKLRNAAYDSRGLRGHLWANDRCADTDLAAARKRCAALRAKAGIAEPIVFETTRTVTRAQLDQMTALYEAREAGARFRWTRFSRAFFERIAAMPEARFSLCRAGERLLGFSSAVIVGDRYVTLRSGVDLAVARTFSVPVLLVLRDIETAIDERCAQITLGPTGYELKARFGVTFSPNVAMTRMLGPLAAASTLAGRVVDLANRKAGIHELHRIDYRSAWQ